MARIAIIVLAGTDGSGDLGRVVNALETAKEFYQAGDDVELIFDGAGTLWIKQLSDEGHRYHDLYAEVKETITGACSYCAKAYGVLSAVQGEGVTLLDEHDGHPSLRRLVIAGYQVITFSFDCSMPSRIRCKANVTPCTRAVTYECSTRYYQERESKRD